MTYEPKTQNWLCCIPIAQVAARSMEGLYGWENKGSALSPDITRYVFYAPPEPRRTSCCQENFRALAPSWKLSGSVHYQRYAGKQPLSVLRLITSAQCCDGT